MLGIYRRPAVRIPAAAKSPLEYLVGIEGIYIQHTCIHQSIHRIIPRLDPSGETSCSVKRPGRSAKCYYTMNKVDKGRSFIRVPLASFYFIFASFIPNVYSNSYTLYYTAIWRSPRAKRYVDLLSLFQALLAFFTVASKAGEIL